MKIKASLFLISSLFFGAVMQPAYAAKAVLTQTDAILRKKMVSDVAYSFTINLTKAKAPTDNPYYSSIVKIDFKAAKGIQQLSDSLFLDFAGETSPELDAALLNGKSIKLSWNEQRTKLLVPTSALKDGQANELTISYLNHFTSKGKGFHREVDRDGKTYIYTNSEPFFANEIAPLFDQPDLKATYTLKVLAPKDWTVFSNMAGEPVELLSPSEDVLWIFPTSFQMSSYLFELGAGPYHVFTPKEPFRIPLRLLARESLAKDVDAEIWFDLTRASFNFYEEHFGEYPFGKYDQIIVPGTASGAMETVAAVTFNEAYVPSGEMTDSQKLRLAATLFHEMAHMWFGNLITMEWWDDLWLNESFATFMSALVVEHAGKDLQLLPSWNDFFSIDKRSAYNADSRQTTHPIVDTIKDTLEGFASFDDITYRKGASVLKQLYFYVGKDAFFGGVRRYFDRHRFGNATRSDFLRALSESSGKDLSAWDQEWLRSSGTNSIQISTEEDQGMLKAIRIQQNPDPISGQLRTHQTLVGLYDLEGEKLVIRKTIPVEYSGALTRIEIERNTKTPTFVNPNLDDYDYVLQILTPSELGFLRDNLFKIQDTLLKQQLYFSLFEMVKNAQLSGRDYIQIVNQNADGEKDPTLLISLTSSIQAAATEYTSPEGRTAAYSTVVDFITRKLKKAPAGTNEQDALFRAFTSLYLKPSAGDWIKALLNGQEKLSGLELNQDRRWRLVTAFSRSGNGEAKELIAAESEKDKSDRGITAASAAYLSIPNSESKREWYEKMAVPLAFKAKDLWQIGPELHNPTQENLTEFVEGRFLYHVLELGKIDLDRKTAYFIEVFYPIDHSGAFEVKVKEFLETHSNELSLLLKRGLLEKIEDSQKSRAAQALH